jgi:hypothetical protein
MSVENLFFTHQVDQFYLYIHEAKAVFLKIFNKRFTSKFKQIFIKRGLVKKRDEKSTYIIQINKNIYLPPIPCVG